MEKRCSECNRIIEDLIFFDHAGYPWCGDCFHDTHAPEYGIPRIEEILTTGDA